ATCPTRPPSRRASALATQHPRPQRSRGSGREPTPRPREPRSAGRTPPAGRALRLPEGDVLGAVPENELAQFLQALAALDDRREVVAGELPGLTGEARVAVGEEQLGLADAARVEHELPGGWVARGVLRPDADVEVAHRDPRGLTAPARLDDLRVEREQAAERRHRLRPRLLLEPRREAEVARPDFEQHHGIFAPCAIQRPRIRRSAVVIPVAFPSGIAVESTACVWIAGASCWISAGVSILIPSGASETFVGCCE